MVVFMSVVDILGIAYFFKDGSFVYFIIAFARRNSSSLVSSVFVFG